MTTPGELKRIAPRIGLDMTLPVIDLEFPAIAPTGRSWKTSQILAWTEGRPFLWFDDETTRIDQDDINEAQEATASLARTINPAVGLTTADFEFARKWAVSQTT